LKYVVVEQGTEYNDNWYDISGIRGVTPKLFNSKIEAREYVENHILDVIGDRNVGSIDYYDSGEDCFRYLENAGYPDPGWNCGLSYREFVEWAKERGDNVLHLLPELFQIFEVDENL